MYDAAAQPWELGREWSEIQLAVLAVHGTAVLR